MHRACEVGRNLAQMPGQAGVSRIRNLAPVCLGFAKESGRADRLLGNLRTGGSRQPAGLATKELKGTWLACDGLPPLPLVIPSGVGPGRPLLRSFEGITWVDPPWGSPISQRGFPLGDFPGGPREVTSWQVAKSGRGVAELSSCQFGDAWHADVFDG